MAFCIRCGCEFNVSYARKKIGKQFGAGSYDEFYPDNDVCEDCAAEELGDGDATGAEIAELMGDSWDDD